MRQLLLGLFLFAMGFGLGVAAVGASTLYDRELNALTASGGASASASYTK